MKVLFLVALGVAVAQADQSHALKDFSVGFTQFTADFYKKMIPESGNFLVSPLSANIILALSYSGAREKTAQEFAAGLHLPEDREKLNQIYRVITPYLKGNDNYTLASANKVYLKNGFEIEDEFKHTAVDVFNAGIENIDFLKKEAVAEMNKWVEEHTEQKIKDIIKPDDLNEDTQAVLINALYFHGQWETQFNAENTKERTFFVEKNVETKLDMMEVTEHFGYYKSDELNAQFVELPYEGGKVTMTFVLPNDVDGLPALEARIADVIERPKYSGKKVHLVIPKFKVESAIQLVPMLQGLGVVEAFLPGANFSGFTKSHVYISKIIQKTYLEVDEIGTTAAAATVVFYEDRALFFDPPTAFIADHPFIYYLKGPTGIMFIGRFAGK